MIFDAVLFDLDGTLTDSASGITRSVAYALDAVGAPPRAAAELLRFVGPPLSDSFRDLVGLDDATAARALTAYRAYFTGTGMFDNRVYAGIEELLPRLAAAGVVLAVATSKPTVYAEQILDHFGLRHHFAAVCGPGLDGSRRHKHEVIADACAALDLPVGSRVVMVGDREHDIAGAGQVGLPAVGVAWGYSTVAELTAAGAMAVAATVPELERLLCAGGRGAPEK